jgi:L-malate glycosyltransferase
MSDFGRPARVLYLNHTGRVSGGEWSLLELIRCLPPAVDATLACPPGELGELAAGDGVRWVPIPEFSPGLRTRAGALPGAGLSLLRGSRAVRRVASGHDLLHANSIRAGVVAGVASAAGGPPVLVHVRDVLPESPLAKSTRRLLAWTATGVIANSRYTLNRLGDAGCRATVAYSPVDGRDLAPNPQARTRTRAELGLGEEEFVFALVGQITPWKGQREAIEALALTQPSPTRLLVVGSVRFETEGGRYANRIYETEIRELARRELGDAVRFLGERRDVPAILAASDAVLVPSWEEPLGRAMLEGMAAALPVIATSVGGPAEVIEDGRTGLLLPPRDPATWARAMGALADDRAWGRSLGSRARECVLARFTADAHLHSVLSAYAAAGVDVASVSVRGW